MTSPSARHRALAERLGSGLLSFPVTHFGGDGDLDLPAFRDHVGRLGDFPIAGLFAAGGTGEFFSLTPDEVSSVVAACVEEAHGRFPVLAPTGHGTRTAIELAHRAADAGADGLLLFPPYLIESDQEGLRRHVTEVCAATDLPVIVYSRANALYRAETVVAVAAEMPNLIGFKDGTGDVEEVTRLVSSLGDRLVYIGGLPTAELFAAPYLRLGVSTYSSAIFNFLPEFAIEFADAVRRGDDATVRAGLADIVLPIAALRNRRPGYAVGIVKAGMRVIGRSAGPVRAPLVDLDEAETAELAAIVRRADR